MKRGTRLWSLAVLGLAVSAGPAWASGWSDLPIANPLSAVRATLSAVSCSSPRACTAVGNYLSNAFGELPLAERWNGTSWRMQPTATSGYPNGSALLGVSCPRANVCVAVATPGRRL